MSQGPGPFRPHVRLRVGVTGHRPGPKLPAAAAAQIQVTLKGLFEALAAALTAATGETRWAFGAAAAELAVISSLAEGADRMAAEAGLRRRGRAGGGAAGAAGGL